MSCECRIIHESVVKEAKSKMLNVEEITQISNLFKVLGDSTRVKVVWALKDREMCVCDIAATLEMTKSAISHQLKTMKDYNVVKCRRVGKNIFYSLNDEHITNIIEITQVHVNHMDE